MFRAIINLNKKVQHEDRCLKCLLLLFLVGTNIPGLKAQLILPASGQVPAARVPGASLGFADIALLAAAGFAAYHYVEKKEEACKDNPCGTGKCVKTEEEEEEEEEEGQEEESEGEEEMDYVCICPPGYFFSFTKRTCVTNACSSVTCGNGGVCTENKMGEVQCACPKNYSAVNLKCKKDCPKGTVEFNDTSTSNRRICYYPVFTRQKWQESRDICASLHQGGDLALIPSQTANDFISGNFFNFGPEDDVDGYWIGVNDQFKEGVYVYLRPNGPVPETTTEIYTNWNPTQPGTGTASRDCVRARIEWDFKWSDIQCDGNTQQALCSVILTD